MVDLDSFPPQSCVSSVAVPPDGAWVVSGSYDHSVQFWNLKDAQIQLMLQGHKDLVYSIDLSPTGGLLATGSQDRRGLDLWWCGFLFFFSFSYLGRGIQ